MMMTNREIYEAMQAREFRSRHSDPYYIKPIKNPAAPRCASMTKQQRMDAALMWLTPNDEDTEFWVPKYPPQIRLEYARALLIGPPAGIDYFRARMAHYRHLSEIEVGPHRWKRSTQEPKMGSPVDDDEGRVDPTSAHQRP